MRKFGTSRRWRRVWLATAAVVALSGSMVVGTPVASLAVPGDPTGGVCYVSGGVAFPVTIQRHRFVVFNGPKCKSHPVDCTADPCVATINATATAAAGQAAMKVRIQEFDNFSHFWTNVSVNHNCSSPVGMVQPQCDVNFALANLSHYDPRLPGFTVLAWRVACDWDDNFVAIRPAMMCGIQMYDQPPN